ncbi:MAG: MBL fold metallo-hydrolase [Dermatophilus congolensis]|nr:MBL fold metallo-hydrolase [Dermatophilus congolensis]
MRVTAVGCSGSYPGPESPASCYLVQAEHEGRTWSIVLDLGNGSLGTLQRYVEPTTLDAVVLSHLHPDHCLDVCSLYVMLAHHPTLPREDKLPVYGPPGVAERMGRAYGVEAPEDLSPRCEFHELADGADVVIGPFTLTPVQVYHPVTTFGVRVAADGAVLAYTGDTDACPALSVLMTGADLVLADSAFVEGRDETEGIHMSGRRAALAATEAGGVKRLVLTHIPAWNDVEVCRAQAAEVWPEVEVCAPGDVFDLRGDTGGAADTVGA